MKKLIVFALAIVMMFSIASCGEDKSSGEEANATTAAGIAQSSTQAGGSVQTTISGGTAKTTTKAVSGGNSNTTKKIQAETSWVPNIYTTTTTEPSYPALKPAEAVSKKTVGDTMTSSITKKNYTLKFIDDFTGTALNASNWHLALKNAGGAEKQANVKENLTIKDGKAILSAKKESATYKTSNGTETHYTGTKFDSSGLKWFKYGRIEAYIKLPYGKGMWPAWWTLGAEDGWPWGGEIDILEMAGLDFSYTCTIHYCPPDTPAAAAYSSHIAAPVGTFGLPNFKNEKLNDKYHVIGMEWTTTKIYMYCDGNLIGSVSITGDNQKKAFHQPHFMILNFALGGMGGTIDDSKLPQTMQVDWVKVWQ